METCDGSYLAETKPTVAGIETRACHLGRLWIRHNGDLHCCYRWGESAMKIGHIDDVDVIDSIYQFYHSCSCEKYVLRKANQGEGISIEELVVEVSLACQGACAFCCCKADEWSGRYEYYQSVTKMIDLLRPKMIVVQGGEVLVQKRTLSWLEKIRDAHPDLTISLVTNGNASVDMVEAVEKLFDEVKVSVFGFEPATYERISGMDLAGVVEFVEELAKRKNVELVLKYVVSPLSYHEANLFLDWAIAQDPAYVFFEDVNTRTYINSNTEDRFWKKISERTAKKMISVLVKHRKKLGSGNTTVHFSNQSKEILGLGSQWQHILEQNDLSDKVIVYWAVGETPLLGVRNALVDQLGHLRTRVFRLVRQCLHHRRCRS